MSENQRNENGGPPGTSTGPPPTNTCPEDDLECNRNTDTTQEVNPATTNVIQPTSTGAIDVDDNGARISTPVPIATSASGAETTAVPTQVSSGEAMNTNGNGNSLSTGAVAGIAVAMLIVGGLIAFVAAFFLFKRRNRKQSPGANPKGYTSFADSTPELVMAKGPNLGDRNSPYVQVSQTPIPAPIQSPTRQLSSPTPDTFAFLPAPAPNSAVQTRVQALISHIHRHVDNFYRDVQQNLTPTMETELARFGAQDISMADLLNECSSPTTAIKHALVAYVLGITGHKKDGEGETLFPEELNGVKVSQDGENDDATLITAAALHRRLSAYLFTRTSSITNPRRSWSVQSDIREAAEHFSLTFFPWFNPGSSDHDAEQDLAGIISEALELQIWLYGQPEEWHFEWEGTGRRGILISPSLVRIDGDGQRRCIQEGNVAAF